MRPRILSWPDGVATSGKQGPDRRLSGAAQHSSQETRSARARARVFYFSQPGGGGWCFGREGVEGAGWVGVALPLPERVAISTTHTLSVCVCVCLSCPCLSGSRSAGPRSDQGGGVVGLCVAREHVDRGGAGRGNTHTHTHTHTRTHTRTHHTHTHKHTQHTHTILDPVRGGLGARRHFRVAA